MADQKPEETVPAEPQPATQDVVQGSSEQPTEQDASEETIAPKTDEANNTTGADAATSAAAKPDEQPAYLVKNPDLVPFFEKLPTLLASTGHDEMWGVHLKGRDDVPTVNVLIKFLRANDGNLQAAEEQLRKALAWRKEMEPLALVSTGKYSKLKFEGLGFVTKYEENGRPLVFTWNIYGAVKDMPATFENLDEFIRWRVALMELAVQDLKMKDATSVIDYDGEDPYQMYQVHDYLNVKFLRMDPTVRAATKKTIEVFSTAYPELLREKFFVNVPAIMGWMFSAMKLILSRNTTRKFHPISNGINLAREFPAAIAAQIPTVYGGKGPELSEGARSLALEDDTGIVARDHAQTAVAEPAEPEPETKTTPEVHAKDAELAKDDEPAKEEPAKDDVSTVTEEVTPAAPEVK
ncbi:hypothetical protein N7474_000260 [Penicillium riverlandense]|uniref:uncharacterized protein n=1 Tax=Penicillium riverlandense TaxID=1903569 RepID=UPI00254827A2|nr:uncharacterized protein N7474_000260 [Penicillium riverlandense]KAJ5831949.1 hypothetical protein N7474_000260 [Penicillium riverlandense]